MRAALGIDFGTTNSTICLYDGEQYHYVELETGSATIPSLMYVNRQYFPTYGERARSDFLSDNLNRQIKLEKTDIGYIEIALGDKPYESFEHTGFNPSPTTYDAKISGFTDRNLPGFLFASTKRLLGQSTINSVRLFEKDIKLEAVVSSIIRHIYEAMKTAFPQLAPSRICVGRPVNYECSDGQERCNELALSRMDKALENAEIQDFSYFLEPIAPVLAHIQDTDEKEDLTILVLDFGGGTLDFSLLKKENERYQVIGNYGIPMGGDLITEQLIKDYIFPRFGLSNANVKTLKKHLNYIEDIIPDLLNWRTTYILNQPRYFMQIDDAIKKLPAEAVNLNRIRLLITHNYSYNLFYAVETAKKQLTDSRETEIDLPPLGVRFTLTRHDLERSIKEYLRTVESSIMSFCSTHGLKSSDVDRVLLTGGTSLIPSIRRSIAKLFPRRVVSVDPFLSIVKGFALGAWLLDRNKITLDGGRIEIDMS